MPDNDAYANRDASVADTIERLRAERFEDVDRELVLEILRLHADGVIADNAERAIDEAIAMRAPGNN
ncbi:MAG: hypothetical protein ACN4E6_18050 [Qipengyuania pacifica]|jgi:hypothetical protein|tara:strand:+ start:32630 stop:32830 length:201 start_codon:yes stop_codon:yes gene_type:complete